MIRCGSHSSDTLLIKANTSGAAAATTTDAQRGQPEATAAAPAPSENNNEATKFDANLDFGFEQTLPDQISRRSSRRCPWRGLTISVLLLLFGSLLIVAGISLISGAFQLKGLDNVTPYLILVFGILCFIPGAYHILVACCALRGHERFSFDDIPYFG